MPVIKANDSAQVGTGRPVFCFDDLSQQGDRYVQQVRAQGRQILEQARQQAAALRPQLEADIRRAAEQSLQQRVEQRANEQLQSLTPALQRAIAGFEQARQESIAHWETQAVHLAAAIAARVIRRELSHDPEIPLNFIREALELATGSPRLRVRLSPADHESLGEAAASLAEDLAPQAVVEFIADAQISPGGCVVETQHGKIDQRIESQLARIEEELIS